MKRMLLGLLLMPCVAFGMDAESVVDFYEGKACTIYTRGNWTSHDYLRVVKNKKNDSYEYEVTAKGCPTFVYEREPKEYAMLSATYVQQKEAYMSNDGK